MLWQSIQYLENLIYSSISSSFLGLRKFLYMFKITIFPTEFSRVISRAIQTFTGVLINSYESSKSCSAANASHMSVVFCAKFVSSTIKEFPLLTRVFATSNSTAELENIDDMSKYIVLNKEGEVQLVTNYKDSKNDPDWKSDKPMVKRIVLPLLEKKLIETK